MTGTSADGIDVACIRASGRGRRMRVSVLGHLHTPFAPALRRRILGIMAPAHTSTEQLARLHADLGEACARAACRALETLPETRHCCVIGLAGQTVCHYPGTRGRRTVTLQLAEPARVAAATGVPVVADFRQSDVARGGQGAPLVPWTDWILLGHPSRHRAVQNIGGIANVTWLPAGGGPEQVIAFDTGPGNMLIDALVALATDGRERMDRHGRRAARGTILTPILARWLSHPFFRRCPPRTTGREAFGVQFARAHLPALQALSPHPDDWIATATALTAATIARSFVRWLPAQILEGDFDLVLCGGGASNATLVNMLTESLPMTRILRIDQLGIPSQAKEAASFAILALARLDGVPASLPAATGADRPAVLGSLWMP